MSSAIKIKKYTPESGLALPYLVRPASINTAKRKGLILLHGVGSNEQDLFSLASYLPESFTVIAPRAPITLGEGRYAWYQVDFSSGKPEIHAAQEVESRKIIKQFIQQVKAQHNLDEIFLGGFSQGAIMSFTIGLTQPDLVTGILAFSGRILQEIRPQVEYPGKVKDLQVFIAHGTGDGTLPVQYAREARVYLDALGLAPAYHEFEIGHQITIPVLTAMLHWLKDQVKI